MNLVPGTCIHHHHRHRTISKLKTLEERRGERGKKESQAHPSKMTSRLRQTRRLREHLYVMLRLLRLLIDTLDHDLLRALVPEQELLVQLARDVVHALVVAQYPLRDGLADFAHEPLHVEVLEHEADDRVCEQVGGCERKHDAGCDLGEGGEEVGCELVGCEE